MAKSNRLESDLQSKVIKSATSTFGVRVLFKIMQCNKNGVPDIFLAVPGFGCIFIEMKKSEDEKPRVNQVGMINMLNKFGCRATVIKTWKQWWNLRSEILSCYKKISLDNFLTTEADIVSYMSPLESNLQSRIIKSIPSLIGKKSVSFKIMRTTKNGIPDLFFTESSIGPVFVELKRDESCKPRINQVGRINMLRACGIKAYVVRSWSEWVDLTKKLKGDVII